MSSTNDTIVSERFDLLNVKCLCLKKLLWLFPIWQSVGTCSFQSHMWQNAIWCPNKKKKRLIVTYKAGAWLHFTFNVIIIYVVGKWNVKANLYITFWTMAFTWFCQVFFSLLHLSIHKKQNRQQIKLTLLFLPKYLE